MEDKIQIAKDNFSQFIHFDKYAKHRDDLQRRETWEETVTRNMNMHIKKFPQLEQEIRDNYKFVYEKKVMPSMRSFQFGGEAIEKNPARGYNCSFLHIDHLDAFSETLWLLLSGVGVGFSVQKHHIEKLPPIIGPKVLEGGKKPRRYLVADSIEGWADAVKVLLESFFHGKTPVEFDFSDIRAKGTQLVTSGGKAPGPEPLRECLLQVFTILNNIIKVRGKGSYLKPIEAHDILCYLADAVLSGGIRRSATISLFSFDDKEMMKCKSNFEITSWEHIYGEGPVNVAGEPQKVIQMHIDNTGNKFYDLHVHYKDSTEGYKEKSIYWVSEQDFQILNGIKLDSPFVQGDTWKFNILSKKKNTLPWFYFEGQRGRANNSVVLVRDKLEKDQFVSIMKEVEDSMAGEPGFLLTNDKELGANPCVEISLKSHEFCNLTSINASLVKTQEDFNNASRVASFIGTLQASYTNFHYLRSKWQDVTEKDALLGVSITGIADEDFMKLNEKEAGKVAVDENERVAKLIGINKASRVTTVKPEGCGVLETSIKTSLGPMTYKEVFEYFGYDPIDYQDDNAVWLPVEEKELSVFDEHNNQQKIINLFVNGVSDVYEFKTDDGKTHRFTSEHKFLTERGWVEVKNLEKGDEILSF